jgi:hypothetical protein
MLNVAIAIDAPTDFGSGAAAIVAGACEEVIGPGRCPVAADLPRGAVAAWFAVVHPDDGALSSVRIEFRDRTAEGVLIEQRTLAFTRGEELRARLVSVGIVIAALAAAREGSIAPLSPRPPLPSPPEPRDGAGAGAPVFFGVDVAGLAVPALGGGVDRLGGFARASLDLQTPLLFSAGAEYAVHTAQEGAPSFGWFAAFAGAGTRVAPHAARFNLELRGELVFEHANVSASAGGARDSGSRDGWGGRIGATLLWRAWPWVSALAGVDGTLVTPRVAVAVGSDPPISIPAATCGFFIGFRISP